MTNDFSDLDVPTQPADPRESFRADAIDTRAEVERLIKLLGKNGDHRKVFQYGGQCVVIVKDASMILRTIKGTEGVTRSVARPCNEGLLLGPIQQVALFEKLYLTPRPQHMREVKVPPWVTKMIGEISGEGLPPLAGIADFPVISMQGQLLTGRLGYDPLSRLYVDSKPVPHETHQFDTVQDAYRYLTKEWLGEFHFDTEADAARALTIPLTIMNRRTRISGGAPIPFVTAPTPATGKTLLVQVLVEAVTGMQIPASNWDHDSTTERRKMFVSIGLENPPAVLFDNINNGWSVQDSTLERWCTSDSISDRLLGKNEAVNVPSTPLLVFTGNNIVAGNTDLETRSFVVRMRRPKKAKRFKRSDIMDWTSKNRPKIFAALLKIALSKPAKKWVPASRFASWNKYVGAPVQFAAGQEDLFKDMDPLTDDGMVNEQLEALCFAMQNIKANNQNMRGYLPKDMSENFSELIAKLDPRGVNKQMYDAAGNLDTSATLDVNSVYRLLRKYDGHYAGEWRFSVFKADNPLRPSRKSWLFKALAE